VVKINIEVVSKLMIKKKLLKFRLLYILLIIFVSFASIIPVNLPAVAQFFPNFSSSEENINSSSNIPIFEHGNLEFAPVFLDGKQIAVVDAFRRSILPENENNNSRLSDASVRSQIINSRLQKILANMVRYQKEILPKEGITDLNSQEQALREQLVISKTQIKGIWVVTATFPKDDVAEIIYSVTEADISKPRFGGSQPDKIAERVVTSAKEILITAWKERQSNYLISTVQRALLILVGVIILSFILNRVQIVLKNRRQQLNNLINSIEVSQLDLRPENEPSDQPQELIDKPKKNPLISIKQRIWLNSLYRTILFWTQWLMWLLGIGYLTSLFYWSRPFSNWMIGVSINNTWGNEYSQYNNNFSWAPIDWGLTLGQEATLGTPLLFLLLIIISRLILKIGDAVSLNVVQIWIQNTSSRQQRSKLRTSTLGQIFRGWLRVITYLLLGVVIAHHLHKLGAITQIVGILLGFISFALSLASQDLLKDLIAGLLILWEDQYAVGDVIIINDQGGLVENIRLRVTQLRNLDGELITIPNRSIETVRNLSSEWSRVNYAIEVNYNTNVDQVLEVMNTVAQELYQDEHWRGMILEAPEILGVDELSHKGILIRLIIKTLPLQQWTVAREFRRRLKNTFDEQGISVGIPQQKMYFNNNESSPNYYQDFPLATVGK
jgi:small conductance mechanosensitive channel